MIRLKWFTVLLLLGFTACSPSRETADTLVINANVYTVDSAFSKATAFAVKDGRFIAVGNDKELQERFSAGEIYDAGGKTIVPGLIDAHCHFYGLGLNQEVVDLTGTKSYEEVLERVKAFQQERNSDFIRGRGWDQNDWEVKEFPTSRELDELFPDTPVALERVDGHAYLVNSAAMKMAGIGPDTEVPGGEVVKESGKPTGVLVDGPMALVDAVMPKPDKETIVRALKAAEKISFDYGLTTVNDAGLDRSVIEIIDSLQQAGELRMRVYAMVSNKPENLDHFLEQGILKTDLLNVRSVKVYGDGALGSRGAVLKAPYSDKPGHFGAMVTPVADIRALAKRIAATEYQMNTHAIGDSANAVILETYAEVLAEKEDPRWKIEHAQVIAPGDFDYFGEKIIPSVQPTHATSDMYWAEDRLGAERVKGAYAFKDLLQQSGLLALGTDFPVEQVNPFLTFYAAVTRQDLEEYPEGGFMPSQLLEREAALKGMTIWAAYSNFEEDEKGSIEAGKFADFVVLDKNIMEVPGKEIPKLKAVKVSVGGEWVK
ncbi:amidohydrolase [Zeaxanthinibacter enoshimensis]|uniref:amidohydrolase n=1 Tax=Zeaxanthinibacter enoshimensis TaxID=392009 RepID=UPI003562021E